MIELRHLRYFIAVAEELNFTRAAERVHIDQTPLSRAVRDLEDELGVQLFVRKPRQLLLTPAGARLLEEARKLFIRFERTKRAVRQTHSLYQAPLRIGVADGISQPLLSECFLRWQSVAPEVPLELIEMRARELAAALKHEDLDIGFSFGVPEDDAIAQRPAWRYRLMAMLPCTHELASRSVVSLRELLAFPLLSCSEDRLPGMFAQMRDIVRRHTEQTTVADVAFTAQGYVTRIAAGVGVGLADAGHAQTLHRSDVVVIPLAEEEQIVTYVLHKHQRFGIAGPVQRFLTHVSTLS
ncbi:MAG: LysR family transcriptional regulator [Hydrogenophaga sp.]|uniref:LysR family transcriptional regulator n=1 Tax=Comamonadaceae TaxID=80864 RepID=UPI0022DCE5D9|nr:MULTISPECIES: LysR family transcriptional regulator [Comamonadaceae]WCT24061.1 LysR family transcriptional regulator [Acidovorax temperans]